MRSFLAALATTIRDAGAVLVAGMALGLLANSLSPRGISLRRDYFPTVESGKPAPGEQLRLTSPNPAPGPSENAQFVVDRFAQKGLRTISVEAMVKLTENPLYQQQLIILIDARDDRHYLEGHIPGALQFDRYFPERYLPKVLPIAFNAEQIVVYCNGGNCEDSEYAAIALKEAGIPLEKISVYPGGIVEWRDKRLPIELGSWRSGNLQNAQE